MCGKHQRAYILMLNCLYKKKYNLYIVSFQMVAPVQTSLLSFRLIYPFVYLTCNRSLECSIQIQVDLLPFHSPHPLQSSSLSNNPFLPGVQTTNPEVILVFSFSLSSLLSICQQVLSLLTFRINPESDQVFTTFAANSQVQAVIIFYLDYCSCFLNSLPASNLGTTTVSLLRQSARVILLKQARSFHSFPHNPLVPSLFIQNEMMTLQDPRQCACPHFIS